ncbi:efflux RND transporter periplasmic adaptor subunit [Rhizorhabdus dicambivorans]|uniref:Efflux RND transporter periplasmic adaptor subunit n=1 Tax=Rhizorhabdus dicambivorans TaxID=1850238 RepID=A0A2A4FWK7_9SPHN|nr:efflux RND transporter periplasmic adaptor subunit [Rhizorhabdus dicambivorans]ATE63704.1 efflux RND transporter periplasmic adaptor subunit [Rhizorhabdus dicambivorans]PCE42834.1 efflux RND transporter periplasmic adaptor subunit [Rhizorhabdus dicambivorans]
MTEPEKQPQQDLDEFLGVEPTSPRATLFRRIGIGLAILVVLVILWRLIFGGDDKAAYATRPVERGDLTVVVSATGNLAPTNQVEVGSEQSGTVTDVYVDNNDRVRKGQLLARLDTSRLQDAVNQAAAGLASAQASVEQAEATAQQARATLRRQEQVWRLSGGKVPSATELDVARADAARAAAGVSTARAAVDQARASLSSAQTALSKAFIKSPVNGQVLSRSIEPGQTVAASLNAPVLFTIAEDLRQMRLEVKVDEADVGQVKKGQKASFIVDAFPGRTFPATIERVDVGANATGSGTSSASGSSGTASGSTSGVVAYTARLTVSNTDGLLRPGMTATADIVTMEKKNVLLVPAAALRFSPDRQRAGSGGSGGLTSVLAPRPMRRGGNRADREAAIGRGSKQTVYVVGEAGDKPQPVEITVGESNGSQAEVVGGKLTEGTQVVIGQYAAGGQGGGSGGGGGGQGGGQRRNAQQ